MKKSMPLSTYSFCNVSTGGSAVLGMVEVRRTVPNGARETRLYGFSIASDVITIMTNQQGVPYLPMTSCLYCACAEARFTVEGQVSQGYDNILYFKALSSQVHTYHNSTSAHSAYYHRSMIVSWVTSDHRFTEKGNC